MPTIREALEQATSAAAAAPETPTPEPVATPEPAPEPVAAAVETPAPDASSTPTSGRERDEAGRFTKGSTKKPEDAKGGVSEAGKAAAPPKDAGAVAEPPATPAPAPTPEAPPLKAPQSLKPAAREVFAKAPRELQEDLVRLDREIHKTMQDSAQARKLAGEIHRSLSPYEPIARSNGKDVMTWAGEGLQAFAAIQSGTPEVAARVAAQMVATLTARFGDRALEMVNAAMTGQSVPQPQYQAPVDVESQVQKALDARLQQAQMEREAAAAQSFVDSQPEFLSEVMDDMVAIIESSKARGRKVTYQEAYDRACKLNEEVAGILAQRKAAEGARTATAATQQARQAAVSVKTQPSQAPKADPKSVRGALEAAARHHGAG